MAFTVEVEGIAVVRSCADDSVVTDRAIVSAFDGRGEAADMAQYLWPDDPLSALGLNGGDLFVRFDSASGRLLTRTRYHIERQLTPSELAALVEYTRGQWADGVGEGTTIGSRDHVVSLGWDGTLTGRIVDAAGQVVLATQFSR